MTRTSAHKARYMIDNMTTDDTMYKLIDRIFDDLDNEICENCIHCHEHSELHAVYCDLEVSCDYTLGQDVVEEDFGCNKFEPKP